MRDLLTGLAIVLILLLTGATVAPHFIDWDSRRDETAARLSEALGQTVEIGGPLDLTLLPTPALKAGHIRIGAGGPLQGSIGRLRAALAVPPLLRGEIRITSALIQSADLTLRLGVAAPVSSNSISLAAIGFDGLTIEDSRIVVLRDDGAPVFLAERVGGQIEAASLVGPLKGSLGFDTFGNRRMLRFSTGRIEGGALRVKALLDNEAAATRTDYDGLLRYEGGALSGEGALAASGNVAIPLQAGTGHVIWRLAAKVKARGTTASIDDIELSLGNTDRQTVFTGAGDVDLARTGALAKVVLSTRQFDLDRLIAGEDPRLAQTPEATARSLLVAIADGSDGRSWLSGEIEVSAGSMLFGGEAVAAPKFTLTANGGAVGLGHLSGELPGRTQFSFDSVPVAGSAVAGRMSLESRDLARLAGWFQAAPPRPFAVRSLSLSGDLRYGAGETRILNAAMRADDMRLNGSIQLETRDARPKLSLSLAADQLDIAKLPDLPESNQPAVWDLDLAVDARRLRYAGVGAGDIKLRLRKDASETWLDELTVHDLDGADLTARGTLGGTAPRLDMRLQAKRMEAILQLADRLSAHWGIPVLATRAASLAPADLAISWSPEGAENRRLTARGRLGDTEIDAVARVTPAGALAGDQSLSLALKAANPAVLLRQIGLDAIPVASAGPVDIRILGGGASARAPLVNWSVKGVFGGVRIDLDARQSTNPAEPVNGRLRLASSDVAPLAQTLLIAVPAISPGDDLHLDAGFDLRGYRITLRDVDLRSGNAVAKGEIAFNLAEFGRVSGQLRLGRIDASSIAPLIFGSPSSERPAVGWDRRPFGFPAAATLPGDLWIEADSLDFGEGFSVKGPRFVVRFDNGLIVVESGEGEWSGGRLTAQGTLRRNEANVSMAGRINVENARLDRLPVPAAAGGLQGRASAQLEMSAIGGSPMALVASLSGTGRLDLRDAAIPGLARGALADLLRGSGDFTAATRGALTASVQQRLNGRVAIPAGQTPLSLTAGVLRAGPFRSQQGAEEFASSLAIDLKDFTLAARTGVVLRESPRGWSGPAPGVEIILRGPWGNPVREIDVSNLANGLMAVAIQREQERIEQLEQDQRERSFFNRRLRASEEQRRAEEEERRRLEAERKALEERERWEEQARREAARQLLIQQRMEEALRAAPLEPPGPPPIGPPLSIAPPIP